MRTRTPRSISSGPEACAVLASSRSMEARKSSFGPRGTLVPAFTRTSPRSPWHSILPAPVARRTTRVPSLRHSLVPSTFPAQAVSPRMSASTASDRTSLYSRTLPGSPDQDGRAVDRTPRTEWSGIRAMRSAEVSTGPRVRCRRASTRCVQQASTTSSAGTAELQGPSRVSLNQLVERPSVDPRLLDPMS